jgi:glycosyltransferase involved in cell wall biosynthesis
VHVLIRESDEALASAVVEVLRDPQLGMRLGVAARALVEEQHGLAEMADRFAELYTSVIAGGRER